MTHRDISRLIGQKLLLAFRGKEMTPEIAAAIEKYRPSGITLFRSLNIDGPAQVRALTDSLQRLARDLSLPPLLIAADQEGGQLMAIGEGVSPIPGNMALGATGSTRLARLAGEVLGRELAAMGINVDYAPVCDVNINPHNPVIGVRSFGEDPSQVAKLAAAVVEGIQSQGVAATAKHFPGHGDVTGDSHHSLPIVPHDLARLHQVEFPPFRSAIDCGVKAIMTAHLALPAIDGDQAPPATLSKAVITGLLRQTLGFDGVVITDAMDMQAIRQGDALADEAVRAVQAGADLLLLTANPADHQRVYNGLTQAIEQKAIRSQALVNSARRVWRLKQWLEKHFLPCPLEAIHSSEHKAIAAEIAEESITLVRDHVNILPLKPTPSQRLAVILPRPIDLTPADTSSYVTPCLAAALRAYHSAVDEFIIPFEPTAGEVYDLVQRLSGYDYLICCTINAFASPAQASYVQQALATGKPVVVAALRLPYDLMAFPNAPTFVCTYSIQEPSMQALAQALLGMIPWRGKLPVSIPGLYHKGDAEI